MIKLVLGGSFDPVHDGHVLWAERIRVAAGATRLSLLPCADPVHRQALTASFEQRVEMLKLAIGQYPQLSIDTIEQSLPTPTFSVQTLRTLRASEPQTSIAWCMGEDSFWSLPSWREAQALSTLCCFIVVTRMPSEKLSVPVASPTAIPDAPPDWLDKMWQNRCVLNAENLAAATPGAVLFLSAPALPFSASALRIALQSGQRQPLGLSVEVAGYIEHQGLYQ